MKSIILILVLSVIHVNIYSQEDIDKVYRINKWGSAAVIAAGYGLNYFGTQRILNKPMISEETLESLNPNDVNSFDRIALSQNYSNYLNYKEQSDILLLTSLLLPVTLALDRKIRSQALDVGLLYLKTFVITDLLYSWGPTQYFDRFRPITYYDDVPLEERTASTNRSSFYSGHTSAAATGLFFTAKVLSDFHPELGGKKWLLYGGATAVSGYMGYLRYRALKHFPTDVIVGLVIGAAGGILIPQWHKKREQRLQMGFIYNEDQKSIKLGYRF